MNMKVFTEVTKTSFYRERVEKEQLCFRIPCYDRSSLCWEKNKN